MVGGEALGFLLRACTKAMWLDEGFALRVTFSPPAGQELVQRPAVDNILVQEQQHKKWLPPASSYLGGWG